MKICHVKNITIGEGIPKICVPLVSVTEEELLQEIQEVHQHPVDLIEWRMDLFENVKNHTHVLTILQKLYQIAASIPLLCTFRTTNEGGNTPLTSQEYTDLYRVVLTSGYIDIIDIEVSQGKDVLQSLIPLAKQQQVKVLLSNHDFEKTPAKEEIIQRLYQMQEWQADIAKIAVMPTSKRDVLTVLDATLTMQENYAKIPLVTMSMNQQGIISRLAGETFGSSITFGSLKEVSAPGQIPVTSLANILACLHKE